MGTMATVGSCAGGWMLQKGAAAIFHGSCSLCAAMQHGVLTGKCFDDACCLMEHGAQPAKVQIGLVISDALGRLIDIAEHDLIEGTRHFGVWATIKLLRERHRALVGARVAYSDLIQSFAFLRKKGELLVDAVVCSLIW